MHIICNLLASVDNPVRKLIFRNKLKIIYNEAKKQRMPLIYRIEKCLYGTTVSSIIESIITVSE